MIRSGLVSITFRKLNPAAIVRLVSQAGLEGIEWGGDVHVPHFVLDDAALNLLHDASTLLRWLRGMECRT